MSSIIFEGNTYVFGATVSANAGTGTTNYIFGGLNNGSTYGFIVWAFNGIGPSSIVGPVTKVTLSEILEERLPFTAFAWAWRGGILGGYQWDVMYSAYGVTSGSDSGNTANYYLSTEDLGNTSWFSTAYTKPTWLNVISGITDPFGGTGAFIFNATPASSQTLNLRQSLGGMPPGVTYVMSFYINLDGTTSGWSVSNSWFAAFSGTRGISMQQILPEGATAASPTIAPNVIFPTGKTGWQRFAWRLYAPPVVDPALVGGTTVVTGLTWENIRSTVLTRTFSAGVTANVYLYGPQFEIET